MKTFMKLSLILTLPIIGLFLLSGAKAEGLQTFEAGAYPITSRIEAIKKIISAIELRLATADLSPEERKLRSYCLIEYSSEKKQLETEYEAGKRISRLPGVIFLAGQAEHNCLQGLTIPASELH